MDVECLVQPLELFVEAGRLDVLVCGRLAARAPERVDAEAPRELREPGPDRAVVAEPVEVLVGAGEDLLEDVLGVARLQPEALHADRVDVAREALDELGPGLVAPFAAARDQFRVDDPFLFRHGFV